jgi:2',3'-cyclic-nucleotide 2'-phosphodiesterase (5'-nucleotidase family)
VTLAAVRTRERDERGTTVVEMTKMTTKPKMTDRAAAPASRSRGLSAAIVVALAAVLPAVLATGCHETAAGSHRKLTVAATGFLKGSLFPHSREYSRKRTRLLGGIAHLAGRIRELESEARAAGGGLLLVDLGNHLSGSVESYVSRGQMVVEMMSRLPYAAGLLSNMEFTYGQDVLRARTAQARFPYVSSNVDFADTKLASRVRREVVSEVAGLRVAVLGMTPENLHQICAPEAVRGVTVSGDVAEPIRRARELKKDGVDLVILLSKMSIDDPPAEDRKALSASEIDLVLGVDYAADGGAMATWGKTLVAGLPADNRGSRIKVVELAFDSSHRRIAQASTVEVISPETAAADEEIDGMLAEFRTQVMQAYQARIGSVVNPLTRGWREESVLANVVTDGMRAVTGAGIALINSGAIQDELACGDVTLKDVFRVLPFDNNILTVKATGAEIQSILSDGLARGLTYQASGLRYVAREDSTGALSLVDLTVGGRPIDPARSYTVAITDFALSRIAPVALARQSAHGTVRDVLTEVLRKDSPIDRRPDGRVVFHRVAAAAQRAAN